MIWILLFVVCIHPKNFNITFLLLSEDGKNFSFFLRVVELYIVLCGIECITYTLSSEDKLIESLCEHNCSFVQYFLVFLDTYYVLSLAFEEYFSSKLRVTCC